MGSLACDLGRRLGPIFAPGQTEKNSLRANVFRVTPETRHCSMQSACRICAPVTDMRTLKKLATNEADAQSFITDVHRPDLSGSEAHQAIHIPEQR